MPNRSSAAPSRRSGSAALPTAAATRGRSSVRSPRQCTTRCWRCPSAGVRPRRRTSARPTAGCPAHRGARACAQRRGSCAPRGCDRAGTTPRARSGRPPCAPPRVAAARRRRAAADQTYAAARSRSSTTVNPPSPTYSRPIISLTRTTLRSAGSIPWRISRSIWGSTQLSLATTAETVDVARRDRRRPRSPPARASSAGSWPAAPGTGW